jgi:hypothetical protein
VPANAHCRRGEAPYEVSHNMIMAALCSCDADGKRKVRVGNVDRGKRLVGKVWPRPFVSSPNALESTG